MSERHQPNGFALKDLSAARTAFLVERRVPGHGGRLQELGGANGVRPNFLAGFGTETSDSPSANGARPLGTRKPPIAARQGPLGTPQHPSGTRQCPFGTRQCPFGTPDYPFGTHLWSFGTPERGASAHCSGRFAAIGGLERKIDCALLESRKLRSTGTDIPTASDETASCGLRLVEWKMQQCLVNH